jgi:putative hemolysin
MVVELLVIFILILINGFFSMSEMAVVSSRKARLRHEAESGKKNYQLALDTAESPSRFLSTIQVVITLIGTLTGAFGGATVARGLEDLFHKTSMSASVAAPLAIGIVVVLTAFVSVILGELVPKNIALARPERIAAAVVRPIRALAVVFSPIVRLLSGTTEGIVSALGGTPEDVAPVTEEEVKVLIAQGAEAGVFDDREREMVEGVFSLGDRRITSLMTPRTDVILVQADATAEEAKRLVLENVRFGYLPVADGDLDRVVGMLPVKDALAALASGDLGNIHAIMKKPVFVPEGLTALEAVSAIKIGAVRTALLVDEYGGVSGLVALSDLMQAVVGELPRSGDADTDAPSMVRREDGSWLVDGSLLVDEFLDGIGKAELRGQGEYETVAGLVLDRMGSIPKAGDICSWDGCRIEVMDMDGNRIDKILVTLVAQEPSADDQDKSLE